jgi:dihydropteroate synthase
MASLLYSALMQIRRKRFSLRLPDRILRLGERTLVMGVLNVTPDSFSDAGIYLDVDRAVERAIEIEREGADILDIGAESTRPGSKRVPFEEELHRLVPVLERLRGKISIPISVDTYKSEVALRALKLGAGMVNDVSGGRWDPRILEVARRHRVPMVLMHMRGDPQSWKHLSPRRAVVQSVLNELRWMIERAEESGIARRQILIDPGFGFGKDPAENVRILGRLEDLASLGYPVCIGTSRKSFLGRVMQRPVADRLLGSTTTVAIAVLKGAHIVRVHDVSESVEVVSVADAILNQRI